MILILYLSTIAEISSSATKISATAREKLLLRIFIRVVRKFLLIPSRRTVSCCGDPDEIKLLSSEPKFPLFIFKSTLVVCERDTFFLPDFTFWLCIIFSIVSAISSLNFFKMLACFLIKFGLNLKWEKRWQTWKQFIKDIFKTELVSRIKVKRQQIGDYHFSIQNKNHMWSHYGDPVLFRLRAGLREFGTFKIIHKNLRPFGISLPLLNAHLQCPFSKL